MNETEIEEKIIQIVKEHSAKPKGITKNELARIFIAKWGSSRSTIWGYILDLIESGKIEFRKVNKQQHALFLSET